MTTLAIGGSIQSVADEAEIRALNYSETNIEEIKSSVLQQEIIYELGEEDFSEEEEETASRITADAVLEIHRRHSILGDKYPFEFDGTILATSENSVTTPYVFQLLLSTFGIAGGRKGPILFESLVTESLGGYLKGGRAIRFGWPNRAPVPTHPVEAVDYLARELLETRRSEGRIKASDKDLGLDSVAWKPFQDLRKGHVILFCQCATGNNWRSKIGDLSLNRWQKLISFTTKPILLFAVPWVLEDDDRAWIEEFGFAIFDRVRATSLLGSSLASTDFEKWSQERLREVKKIG